MHTMKEKYKKSTLDQKKKKLLDLKEVLKILEKKPPVIIKIMQKMNMLTLVPGLLCLRLRVNILDFIFKMQAKIIRIWQVCICILTQTSSVTDI